MIRYTQAKKKLFDYVLTNTKQNKYASFPADDKIGKQWFDEMPFDKKLSFGIVSSASLKADRIHEKTDGTEFSFSYLGKSYEVKTHLLGKFNVSNILAALSVAIQIGVDIQKAITSIQ
jgi:UDP-N-acetylmuramyl tripeptide synthase